MVAQIGLRSLTSWTHGTLNTSAPYLLFPAELVNRDFVQTVRSDSPLQVFGVRDVVCFSKCIIFLSGIAVLLAAASFKTLEWDQGLQTDPEILSQIHDRSKGLDRLTVLVRL